MTPNLLDELEKIVALSEKATDGPFMVDEYADVTANGEDVARIINCDADAHLIAQSVNFLRTHAPALADMAKRMEAAERDAAILRNARIHLPTKVGTQKLGDYSPEEMAAFDSGYNMALDRAHNLLNRYPGAIAAIDATQEGEG